MQAGYACITDVTIISVNTLQSRKCIFYPFLVMLVIRYIIPATNDSIEDPLKESIFIDYSTPCPTF